MPSIYVNLLVEGRLDEVVLRRILARNDKFAVNQCYGVRGKQYPEDSITRYNHAAAYMPFVCMVDLDQEDCAPGLINRWLPGGIHPNLVLRVAVRAIESWLLADRENVAAFLGLSPAKVPLSPDSLSNPKVAVVNLAKQSRLKGRAGIVPDVGSSSIIGKDYVP